MSRILLDVDELYCDPTGVTHNVHRVELELDFCSGAFLADLPRIKKTGQERNYYRRVLVPRPSLWDFLLEIDAKANYFEFMQKIPIQTVLPGVSQQTLLERCFDVALRQRDPSAFGTLLRDEIFYLKVQSPTHDSGGTEEMHAIEVSPMRIQTSNLRMIAPLNSVLSIKGGGET